MNYSESERIFDELLLTRVQTGDRRAGELLAARWHPRLMRTAFRLLRDKDQAQVAVQEAWSGICKGWRSLRDPARFPAWAYTILHRKCADQVRQNQNKLRRESTAAHGEASINSSGEDKASLEQAFDRLSADHRTAAILYFGAGLTVKEIAHVIGTPTGTAKSRLFHARRQLKASLHHDQNDKGD